MSDATKALKISRYGVHERDVTSIMDVFSTHLIHDEHADLKDEFYDARNVIMREIHYAWDNDKSYRALQIAMLRLIAAHHHAQDRSSFIPFMLSMASLPWRNAHGWYLMRTAWARQTIYSRHIPVNDFTVNRSLTHIGTTDTQTFGVRNGAVYRIGTPTEMQRRILCSDSKLFQDVMRSNIHLLGKSAVNEYVRNVVSHDTNILVETLPFLPPDYLTNDTCVELFKYHGDHFALRHAIIKRIPYRIDDNLWKTIKKFCFQPLHTGGTIDYNDAVVFRQVPYLSKDQILDIADTGDSDLIIMLLNNRSIAWDRMLVSLFLSKVKESTLRIRDLTMNAFMRVGFISESLFKDISQKDSWGDLDYGSIVSSDEPHYRYLNGAATHRVSSVYKDDEDAFRKRTTGSTDLSAISQVEHTESIAKVQIIRGTYTPPDEDDKWIKYVQSAVKSDFFIHGEMPDCKAMSTDKECQALAEKMRAELNQDFPNFKAVTNVLLGQALSCKLSGRPLRFHPMVLLGDAGIGKTSYLQSICQRLSLHHQRIDMGGISAGFTLSGSHGSWRGGQPGLIAKTFLTVRPYVANPVFILDEIDKAQGSDQHPVYPVLLPMIESATASSFQDEFLEGVYIDLTYASFVMTANSVSDLPDSFQSRVLILDVPQPTATEKRTITNRMYTNKKQEMMVTDRYAESLDDAMLDKLCSKSLRDADRLLSLAMTNAMMRIGVEENVVVSEADLEMVHTEKKVGF